MLNRTGKIVAFATFIAVSTLTFSSATLLRDGSKLSASNVNFGKEHLSMSFLSDRFKSSLPIISDLSKPNVLFWFCGTNKCGR